MATGYVLHNGKKNSPVVYNIWEGYYKFILGANAALDYIGDVNGTEAEKNYVIAQAFRSKSILLLHVSQSLRCTL